MQLPHVMYVGRYNIIILSMYLEVFFTTLLTGSVKIVEEYENSNVLFVHHVTAFATFV